MEFIDNVLTFGFKDGRAVNVSDEELARIAVSESQAQRLFKENEGIFSEVLKHQITKEDIVSIGYRKKQLGVYSRLLDEPDYFEDIRIKKSTTKEGLWQNFFEKNKWIFGYGLNFLFLSSLDSKKLEQVVQGHNAGQYGKRVDALMKTRGIISSLCFVEIKTHESKLLAPDPYRTGCWAPSKELTEAVAQIQGTVVSAIDDLTRKLEVKDSKGNPTGEEAYNFAPKSFLVIGSLSEFQADNGTNEDMYRSFELYRRNMLSPEILTFDELFERTRYIVEADGS